MLRRRHSSASILMPFGNERRWNVDCVLYFCLQKTVECSFTVCIPINVYWYAWWCELHAICSMILHCSVFALLQISNVCHILRVCICVWQTVIRNRVECCCHLYNIFNDTRALSRAAQVHTSTLSFEVVAYSYYFLFSSYVFFICILLHSYIMSESECRRLEHITTFQHRIRTQFAHTNHYYNLKFDINNVTFHSFHFFHQDDDFYVS